MRNGEIAAFGLRQDILARSARADSEAVTRSSAPGERLRMVRPLDFKV
jgi:hypothetical protein